MFVRGPWAILLLPASKLKALYEREMIMNSRAKSSKAVKPKKARGQQPQQLIEVGMGQGVNIPDPPETQFTKLGRRLDQLMKEEAKLADEFQKQRRKLDKMDPLDDKYFIQQGHVIYQAQLLMGARETLRLILGRGLAAEVPKED